MYVPYIFRQFQGFNVRNIKESHVRQHMRFSLRTRGEKEHLQEVTGLNQRMMYLEFIKERIHRMFESRSVEETHSHLCTIYDWAVECGAGQMRKWIVSLVDKDEFWSYFEHPYTTSISEGINRVIKGLKWQAYGYKDMAYFSLKIMQKCGYLNYQYVMSNYK